MKRNFVAYLSIALAMVALFSISIQSKDSGSWIGFWGNVVGGVISAVVTIWGIRWTIARERENSKDLLQQEMEIQNKARFIERFPDISKNMSALIENISEYIDIIDETKNKEGLLNINFEHLLEIAAKVDGEVYSKVRGVISDVNVVIFNIYPLIQIGSEVIKDFDHGKRRSSEIMDGLEMDMNAYFEKLEEQFKECTVIKVTS